MFELKVILVLLVLAPLVWGLCRFLQSALYTEVPASLWWRSAIAAGIVWTALLVWPVVFNVLSDSYWPVTLNQMFFVGATRTSVEFREFIVPGEAGREVRYGRVRLPNGKIEYRDPEGRPIPGSALVLVGIPEDGERQRFEVVTDDQGYIDRSEGLRYRSDDGRIMTADDFGRLSASNYGQFFLSLFADLFAVAVWFAALWLVMLFQWPHALGLSIPALGIWAFALDFVFTAQELRIIST